MVGHPGRLETDSESDDDGFYLNIREAETYSLKGGVQEVLAFMDDVTKKLS